MEVYLRQDVWVNGRTLTKEEKLNDEWKKQFYEYYYWRQRHCQKADFTVKIVGNKTKDAENVCNLIVEQIFQTRNT